MPTHRLVLSRLRRQLPTMTAVVALIVITTTLLAVLAQFVSASGDSAAQRALTAWQASGQTTVVFSSHPDPKGRTAATSALTDDLSVLPRADVSTSQVSASYGLPGKTASGDPPLMTFWTVDGLDHEADLVAGAWPKAGGSGPPTVQAAVPKAAADELKLTVGSQVTVTNRVSDSSIQVEIVGIYRPHDTADRFWQLDPLGGAGVYHPEKGTSGFDNYGPFAIDPSAFDRTTTPVEFASLRARIVPDIAGIGGEGLQPFADALASVQSTLKADSHLGSAIQVSVAAPALITGLRHSLAVVASSALIPTVLLAVLALCALVMSASLLSEYRALTTALMRARGAGTATVGLQSLLESLLFTVPAAVVAPFVATAVVPHLLSVDTGSGPRAAAWIAAGATAALCTATLVVTALRGTTGRGTYADAQRAKSRARPGNVLRRVVLELGLIALGLLGYSQLHRYGAADASGSDTGVNLVLVTAPAFALAAAALISVRIVPLFGRLGQAAAGRGRRFAFSFGAWRAGRSGRIGTPALLLVAGVAMAVLSTSYSASWKRAQTDQGTFSVGSDVRASGYDQPGILTAGVVDRLPGAAAAMLVGRDTISAGSSNASVKLLAVRSDKLAATMNLRDDLYAGGTAKLAADLGGTEAVPTLPLPGKPTALLVKVKGTVPSEIFAQPPTASLGVSYTGRVGPPADTGDSFLLDGQEHDLTLPLAATDTGDGVPAWPLSLRGVSLAFEGIIPVPVSPDGSQPKSLPFSFDVLSVQPVIGGTPGPALAPPDPKAWRSKAIMRFGPGVTIDSSATAGNGVFLHGSSTVPITNQQISESVDVGYGEIPEVLSTADPQPAVPVVASAAYLAATGQHLGDVVKLTGGDNPIDAKLVGVTAAVPTVGRDTPALLVDFDRWDSELLRTTGSGVPGSNLEWWVRAEPGQAAAVATALKASGRPAQVDLSSDTVRTLTDDPALNGVRAAYLLAAAAALAFAAIDFLVHLIGAVRERTTQNALVRALGATRREVGVATSVELAFLVGVGLAAGAAAGELLAHLLVPAVMVTHDGSPAVPAVLVTDPWVRIAELGGASVAALSLGVAAVLLSSRRTAVGSMLRLGED